MDESEDKAPYNTAQASPPNVEGGQAMDKPQDIREGDDPEEGGDNAADDATTQDKTQDKTLDKTLDNKDQTAPPLMVSVTLYGVPDEHGRYRSAFLAVREGEVDPLFETVLTPTLQAALDSVAPLLELARLRWVANPKYPAYQRPAPPPGQARPVAQRPAVTTAPKRAPLPKSAPKGQTGIFE